MNLDKPEVSYIIASSKNIEALKSYLYGKEYSMIEIKGYYNGEFEESVLAWSNIGNDELRRDSKNILQMFNQDSLILKLSGENFPRKLYKSGKERELGVIMYNTDSSNKSYLYNGVSFSFQEKKSYKFLREKSDFKSGMIIECESKGGWIQKEVRDPEIEFTNVYSILAKYNKVRVGID